MTAKGGSTENEALAATNLLPVISNVIFLRDFDQLPEKLRGGAVSIGNFDGVHRGHARICRRLAALAHRVHGPSVVFTFDPHPIRLIRPEAAPPPLSTTPRKAELLSAIGIDVMIAFPTDWNLLQLDAREFFHEVLQRRLGVRGIVEGPNFHFGRGRSGNIDLLQRFCDDSQILLDIVEPVAHGDEMVSSSRLRSLIAAGRVEEARGMLTAPYRVVGEVIHGAHRGRTLGYPTANLGPVETILPCEGIYAGRVWVDGRPWPAAIALGPNPTFGEDLRKFEVHLLDFEGDLYGRLLEVDFLAHLRDIKRFASVEELLSQMAEDIAAVRKIFESQAAAEGRGRVA